ncbi:MAG: 7TM domain-containing protein [Phycisphaerae bacterium]
MREQRAALWTATALAAVGIACMGLRRHALRQAPLGPGDSVWRLTYEVRFVPAKAGARVKAALPQSGPHARVVREDFAHPGLSMDILRSAPASGREAVAVSVATGQEQHFSAAFDVHVSAGADATAAPLPRSLSAQERAHYLRRETAVQTDSPPVAEALSLLKQQKTAKGDLPDLAFAHCAEAIEEDQAGGAPDAAGALSRGRATTLGRARAMVALCRAGRVPARLVSGFVLEPSERPRPHVWAEAYADGRWVPYDPENGYAGELPGHYLPVRRGGTEVVWAAGVDQCRTDFLLRRIQPPVGLAAARRGRPTDALFLTRLPAGAQHTLTLLLLLPAGALLTALFRNMVGVQTFGTFTPSLLALSLAYTDWRIGLGIIVLVLAVGLAGRALLERLRLLMVPRLSVVLTMVVLGMAAATSALVHLGLVPSAAAVVLPLVIVTMVVERFHIGAQEDGIRYALRLLAGTFAVAGCCYLLLQWKGFGRFLLTFPEALLVVAAALVLVGRYSGYRLSEWLRYRGLVVAAGGGGHR